MRSSLTTAFLVSLFLATVPAVAGDPTTQPITTARGEVGDLLRKWYAEGTAAGNVGDWYDNRDRGHSNLDLTPYPQIQKISYSEEDRSVHRDWAAQVRLLPMVVFGNSSTSAGINTGGSNVRMYYVNPQGLPFLYMEYTHNNVYMYPEHCDHRPGHNGTPNHGDVYPTNTPFLITSQGSSGSDQPFMHAVPSTLAAFRPEVKKKLAETGLLMPTLQMILRACNKQLKDPGEYLTGKAHSPVFDGPSVDPLKMVKMAHDITLLTIPPLVQLKVMEEDGAQIGRDFFEAGGSEKLGDTPVVIARIFRAAVHTRRIVVSAEDSIDLNKHALTYTWVVTQGDETKIRITPMNEAKSVAEILVEYPERRPVAPGSALESNRVDIAVFVNNGTYNSAPGFVTFFSLDSEARTYDDTGRLLEIGYAMGEEVLSVGNWRALFDALKADAPVSPGVKLLIARFTDAELVILKKAGEEYAPANAAASAADQKQKDADAAAKNASKEAKPAADAALKAAATARQAAFKAAEDLLSKSREGMKQGVKARVESALNDLAADPSFWPDHAADLLAAADKGQRALVANARKRLIGLGVIKDQPGDALELSPIRTGSSPAAQRLTRYEKAQLQRFNGEVIANLALHGIVNATWRDNFVDVNLSAAKSWRDVYHFDDNGIRTGWIRYDGRKPEEFTADGLLVLEKDGNNHPTKQQTVRYERQQTGGFPLKEILGEEVKP